MSVTFVSQEDCDDFLSRDVVLYDDIELEILNRYSCTYLIIHVKLESSKEGGLPLCIMQKREIRREIIPRH